MQSPCVQLSSPAASQSSAAQASIRFSSMCCQAWPPSTTKAGLVRDTINLDGGAGTDDITINLTSASDYIVNVNDTGLANDGSDTLVLNGTSAADTFLVRSKFIAVLQGNSPTYERINYNETINGRLVINGLLGNDRYVVDDNSAITTRTAEPGMIPSKSGRSSDQRGLRRTWQRVTKSSPWRRRGAC